MWKYLNFNIPLSASYFSQVRHQYSGVAHTYAMHFTTRGKIDGRQFEFVSLPIFDLAVTAGAMNSPVYKP